MIGQVFSHGHDRFEHPHVLLQHGPVDPAGQCEAWIWVHRQDDDDRECWIYPALKGEQMSLKEAVTLAHGVAERE